MSLTSSVTWKPTETLGQRSNAFVLLFPDSTLATLLGVEGKHASLARR